MQSILRLLWFLVIVMLVSCQKPALDKLGDLMCATLSGYTFYPYLSVSSIRVLKRSKGLIQSKSTYNHIKSGIKNVYPIQFKILKRLAVACNATLSKPDIPSLCNAFDTTGNLMVVSTPLLFSKLDVSSGDLDYCDGVYIAKERTAFGMINEAAETPETLARNDISTQVTHHQFHASRSKLLETLGLGKNNTKSIQRHLESIGVIGNVKDRELVMSLLQPSVNGYKANSSRPFPYISNIRNQGSCGTCVSFAFTALAEAAMAYALGNKTNTWDLSEQWLFFCHPRLYPEYTFPTCTGWTAGSAMKALQMFGDMRERCMPYVGGQSCKNYCQANIGATHRRVFVPVVITLISDAKAFIRSGGAIASYMQACTDFVNANRTWPGKPYIWDRSGTCYSHAVLVIGFNDEERFWQIKNAWGTYWGEYGYMRVSYHAGVNLMCEACTNNMIGMRYDSVPASYNLSLNISIRGIHDVPPMLPLVANPVQNVHKIQLCGDDICDTGENCNICPGDCKPCSECGDNICHDDETCLTCETDCGSCRGNGLCDPGETCNSVPEECGQCVPMCGDGVCSFPLEYGQGYQGNLPKGSIMCINDCGSRLQLDKKNPQNLNICGDGVCQGIPLYNELCNTCPADCGSCTNTGGFCGDGLCVGNETVSTCAKDCSDVSYVPKWLLPKIDQRGIVYSKSSFPATGYITCTSFNNDNKTCPSTILKPEIIRFLTLLSSR